MEGPEIEEGMQSIEDSQRLDLHQMEGNAAMMDDHVDYDDHEHLRCMCSAMHDDLHLGNRNPKHFSQFPSCYMMRIPAAGKMTYKSESVGNVLTSC